MTIDIESEEGNDGPVSLDQIAAELKWTEAEKAHALQSAGKAYGLEVVLEGVNGREVRCAAAPQEVTYVRVTEKGHELLYLSLADLREDTETALGLMMGVAAGGKRL